MSPLDEDADMMRNMFRAMNRKAEREHIQQLKKRREEYQEEQKRERQWHIFLFWFIVFCMGCMYIAIQSP